MSPLPDRVTREEQLARRFAALGVQESDLEEHFVRSAGHGGQNVNKTATCVMLLHRPTGIQVKCQSTRQQGLNRFLARQILLTKLEAIRDQRIADNRDRAARLQRQKRKRSRSSKERMLANKARNAQKKSFRGRVDAD